MGTGCLAIGVSELLLVEESPSSFCDCLAAEDDAAFTGLSPSEDESPLEELADFLTAAAIFLCLGRTLEEAPASPCKPLLLVGSLSLEELEELSSSAGCTLTLTTCLSFFLELIFFNVFVTLELGFLVTDVFCSSFSSSELDSEVDCFFFFKVCVFICFSLFLFVFEVILSSV